jgi:hypothetical protein
MGNKDLFVERRPQGDSSPDPSTVLGSLAPFVGAGPASGRACSLKRRALSNRWFRKNGSIS